MSECKFRAADGECLRERKFPYKEYCVDGPCQHYTAQTNAERIRAMTDEELAKMLFSLQVQTDVRGGIQSVGDWMKYLSQEYQKREWDT